MSEKRSLKARKKAEMLRRRRKRRIKRALVLIAELLILALLGGVAYVMVKYDKFQTVSFGENDIKYNKGVKLEGYTTVALFGGDSREGDLEAGAHADTIILASINGETKEVRLASVYRDTIAQQVNGKMKKANYAYFSGGPKDAINMLNKNFDLDIRNYVTVDFKALADVIDLLGGIEVEITEDERVALNEYLRETARAAGKESDWVKGTGLQKLDGVQAVTYARIRKNVGGDYKRTERQRIVIAKVAEKAKTMKLGTINKIINKVFPQISTSFSLSDLIGLASGVFEYEIGKTTSFPMESMDANTEKLGSIIVPVGVTENVEELHQFLYPDKEYKGPSDTVKEIEEKIEKMTGITRENLETSGPDVTRSSFSLEMEEKKTEE